ncbi:MAG: hypothetical protein QOG48_1516 [Verrucomicrobiota bacterium]|jgi:hypothetical protein
MKTALKLTAAVVAVAFCGSALANPTQPPVKLAKQHKKACYAVITGSAIPQPCDRLSVIPTTANVLLHIGGNR